MNVSEKLYKLRQDSGLSQKEFAEKVGTSQSAINYWENGKRHPRTSQLKKIAQTFDIPLYTLIDDNLDIWDVSDERNKKRARIIGDTSMEILPRITINDNHNPLFEQLQQELDEDKFARIIDKMMQGKELTLQEENYRIRFLENHLKNIGDTFLKYYRQLNEEGQKKADDQISRTLEFLMLISKIPEYQKK